MKRGIHAVPESLQVLIEQMAHAGLMRDFYLAGGTGLALLLNHRRSIDIDLFSGTNRLDFDGRRDLFSRLRRLSGWALIEAKDGTVHGRLKKVRTSFFWYPEPLLKPTVKRGGVRIASVTDIGLMKLAAIIGRGSRKDFVDLYAICRELPLSRLLKLGGKKFKHSGDFPLQALKALVYFEDAEKDPPAITPQPLSWTNVKAFFIREVRTLTRQSISGIKPFKRSQKTFTRYP
ncbi:MAG: nucleotidyl transferase AbiEii/AbiGii toxin family protein [Candidatus Omnitrophica bacterium]|nr:nucleotidyl transferase AbiEii/AbiGii toxin family protein [Candidatus Omnitrophota bacterium]